MSDIYRYLLKLFVALIIVFLLHIGVLYFLKMPLFENKLILSYVVNFIMATVILLIVEKTLHKKSAQSGFIFMAGSGLKFLVFFLVFYPSYKRDGALERAEFIAFFIPYALCLIIDVIYLSKRLNNQSYS